MFHILTIPISNFMKGLIHMRAHVWGLSMSLWLVVACVLFFNLGAMSQTTKTFKIFGPKYQQVTIKSNTLAGAVYFLKSGHGGPDPGAMGKYGGHTLCEDEYAYDVILRLGRNLIEQGATVYFIIRDPNDGIRDDQYLKADKDEVCTPDLAIPLNQVQRLRQRTGAINKLSRNHKGKFQRMISVHVDARSKNKNIDVFFYHDHRSKTGQKTARIMKETFEEKYRRHQPNRGYQGTVSDRNLYVVANSLPVSVYIELGNIHHSRDQQRIVSADNRQALANWMTEALVKDFKTNK
ncbi:MAG TPA: N-acetylmuramoyl-L-alanine amidase [Prolixibacteraceae bacterium]|jgi:N-acetylmuramoyl-L-alanine amidase|nr:N-acetylmuramoyl-L-alanine amidase [Prolixibacteraceae bacterium]